jgi:hypothetical protein
MELGLHTADLFPIPDDLAPLDPYAGGWAVELASHAMKPEPDLGEHSHAVRGATGRYWSAATYADLAGRLL